MGIHVDRERTPNLLTPEFQEKFVEYVRNGSPIRTASWLMKVTPDTVYGWMTSGENPDSPCRDFYLAVMRAEAEGEQEVIEQWRKLNAGKADWRSLQNYLERRYRDNWSDPTTKAVQVNVQHSISKLELVHLNDVELQQYLDRAEQNRRLLEAGQKVSPIIDVVAQKA